MSFTVCLYISLAIFVLGLCYKVSGWFRYSLDEKAKEITMLNRVSRAIKGVALTLLSKKVKILLRVFVFDILFQARTLKASRLRWSMHVCLFGGFMGLLLMHALDRFTTAPLFIDYYPTLNPFLFLRNLFAFLVITGLILAAYRRFFLNAPRLMTGPMDFMQ